MDSGEKCFVSVAAIVGILLLSAIGYNMHSNYLVLEAIKAGADPIAATCAINGIDSRNQMICQGKLQ